MSRYDQAALLLATVALACGAATFRVRRRRGSSRAIATFAAGMAAGSLVAVAIMLLYDQLMPPRASIGLERIVGPIVTLFVSLVGSALAGGVVHLLDGRRRSGMTTVSVDAESILQAASRRVARERGAHGGVATPDWRAFARDAARPSE